MGGWGDGCGDGCLDGVVYIACDGLLGRGCLLWGRVMAVVDGGTRSTVGWFICCVLCEVCVCLAWGIGIGTDGLLGRSEGGGEGVVMRCHCHSLSLTVTGGTVMLSVSSREDRGCDKLEIL